MRREKQEPVVGVLGRQLGSATNELLHDNAHILVAEMALLLDQVSRRPSGVFQMRVPSKRANAFPSRRISALGNHFWRAGRNWSRSGAMACRGMFGILARSVIMNNA